MEGVNRVNATKKKEPDQALGVLRTVSPVKSMDGHSLGRLPWHRARELVYVYCKNPSIDTHLITGNLKGLTLELNQPKCGVTPVRSPPATITIAGTRHSSPAA